MSFLPITTDIAKVPAHITFEQYKELRTHIEKKDYKLKSRDLMLITLCWELGGRITDICTMTVEMIDFKQNQIKLWTRKRKKMVTIIPNAELLYELTKYIQSNNLQASDKLFGISRQQAHRIIKSLGKEIGIQLHPHMFRHGLAIYLMYLKVPTPVIAARLGHANPSVTQNVYQKVTPDIQRDFMKDVPMR